MRKDSEPRRLKKKDNVDSRSNPQHTQSTLVYTLDYSGEGFPLAPTPLPASTSSSGTRSYPDLF